MKKINLFYLLCIFSLLVTVSCKKDKYTDYSTLVYKNAQVGDLPALISTLDKDTVIEIPFTLTEKPIADMYITVKSTSGTALEDEDFEILTPSVFIPAFTQSGLIQIHILGDDIIEGAESFVIQVGDSTDANVHLIKEITFNLDDFVSSEFDMTFNWNKIVNVPGIGNLATGPNWDVDFYLLDATFTDVGNYDAATGSSPEHMTLDFTNYTGTYYVFSSLFQNVFTHEGIYQNDTIPIKTTFHRQGSLAGYTYTQPNIESYTLSSPDYLYDHDETLIPLFKLVISNTGFSVYDTADDLLVSARHRYIKIGDLLNKPFLTRNTIKHLIN